MSTSARHSLPFLVPGQAQKELFHNEALQMLDIIVQPVVEGPPVNEPPIEAEIGSCYLVGVTPTGHFAGHEHAIACWTEGGWRFVPPFEGMGTTLKASGEMARYTGGAWRFGVIDAASVRVGGRQVLSAQQSAIADATGGAIVDEQARSTLSAVLEALRAHGLIGTD